jgi:hypothetical protein
MEIDKDSDTILLCRFSNYTCDTGETAEHSSTDIVPSAFMTGVMINDSDTLRYYTSGNLNFTQGTLEFWVKIGIDPLSNGMWFFSTGYEGVSEIHIYNDFGEIYFEYFDSTGMATSKTADISSWGVGEWHHIAAIWDVVNGVSNREAIDLFLDGTNSTTSFDSTNFDTLGTTGAYLYLGSLADGEEQAYSTFDELRISDVVRSESEINQTYNAGAGNHSSESVNWTVTGISDGTYIWNCLAYDNESQSSWGTQNYTLRVDTTTPPAVNSISLSPSSDDGIDPGVTVNVTANITDLSNVSSAIFQYKYDVDWINLTMQNISGDLWNTSFTTIGSERTYYYRIWANDTLGNSNVTQDMSVNSTLDYSWIRTPSSAYASGFVNTVDNAVLIRINNTGDDTLIITLSDDWPILDVYYNTSEQFSVPSGSAVDINVTARFASFDSTSNMTITISADPSAPLKTASPETQGTTITMSSYTGGPYLYIEMTQFSTSVYQGGSMDLTATLRNIGNETAEDVWINWSLPPGWTNSSGNATEFLGNLSSQSPLNTSSITVSVGSSAPSGISIICFNASGVGVNNSHCENIAVLCSDTDGVCGSGCTYLNDDDCSPPDTGGGGGTTTTVMGGGLARTDFGVVLDVPDRVDINRGENASFIVDIEYDLTFTADGVSIETSGYPLTYTSVSPEGFDDVNGGVNISFLVTLEAPGYISTGHYDLDIELSGKGKTSNYTITGSAEIPVYVHSTGNESDLFEQARAAAQDMIERGWSAGEMEDLISQMDSFASEWRYDEAKAIADGILATSGNALGVMDIIGALGTDLGLAAENGFSTPDSQRLYELALAAFQRGDYERSGERASNARSAFSIETFGMLPLVVAAKAYWYAIAASAAGLLASGILLKRKAALSRLRRRIGDLENEEKTIESMIIRMQREYFSAKPNIGIRSYTNTIQDYNSRLAEIRAAKTRLQVSRRGGILSGLKRERDDIIRFIKNMQTKYFSGKGFDKSLYEATMKEMRRELLDIDRDIASRKRKGSSGFIAVACILSILLVAGFAYAQVDYESALADIESAASAIDDMSGAGFGTSYANDTLNEARMMLSRGEYAAASALAAQVWEIRDSAFYTDGLIDDVEDSLYTASAEGLDVSGASDLFSEGVILFESENYLESRDRLLGVWDIIEDARSSAAIEQSLEDTPGKFVMNFFGEYWHFVLLFLAAGAALFLVTRRLGRRASMRKKLRKLERERSSVEGLISKAQERYFRIGSIGKMDYDDMMKRYGKRVIYLDKEINSLRNNIGGRLAGKGSSGKVRKTRRSSRRKGHETRTPLERAMELIKKAEASVGKNPDLANMHYRDAISIYRGMNKASTEAAEVYKRLRHVYDELIE